MKLYFLILSTFNLVNINAISFENYRTKENTILSNINLKEGKVYTVNNPLRNKYLYVLNDPSKFIKNDFSINKIIRERVKFWFSIYTTYTSNNVVFHDKENLAIVYHYLDFTKLDQNTENKHLKFSLQNKLVNNKVKEFKQELIYLATTDRQTPSAIKIINALQKANIKIPLAKLKRKQFFLNLSKTLRAQTGQRDKILLGLEAASPYLPTIKEYFKHFQLPQELLAVPFLESSFNINARSKVNAVGAWQFMPWIGKHFMKVDRYRDQRKNALIATVSALHLLAQNKKILKHWDLAVSAYNNGTGLLLKGTRSLKKRGFKNPTLIDLLKHYKNNNFGFASRNFYSSFLALVHALSYKTSIYKFREEAKKPINLYVSKCRISPRYFINTLKRKSPQIREMNNHFKKRHHHLQYKKGSIFTSDVELTNRKYHKVTLEQMRRNFPKNWIRFVKNDSCT